MLLGGQVRPRGRGKWEVERITYSLDLIKRIKRYVIYLDVSTWCANSVSESTLTIKGQLVDSIMK